MLARVVAVFAAAQGILSALGLLEVSVEAQQGAVEPGFGDVHFIVNLVGMTVVDAVFQGYLVDGERVGGVVELQA